MTIHNLTLSMEPFAAVSLGRKTIESRLYDERRQGIKVGDEIIFTDRDRTWRTLRVKVVELLRHDTFRDLFSSTDPVKFGKSSIDELLAQVDEFYSEEDQAEFGVVGIVFEVITEGAVKRLSAGGVVIHDGKVLAISWTTQDFICLPKGGIDEGETSEEAAVREVYEETGYQAEIIRPIGSWTYRYILNGALIEKTSEYYLMKLVSALPSQPQREIGEDFENLWIDIEEAKTKLTLDDSREALEGADWRQ